MPLIIDTGIYSSQSSVWAIMNPSVPDQDSHAQRWIPFSQESVLNLHSWDEIKVMTDRNHYFIHSQECLILCTSNKPKLQKSLHRNRNVFQPCFRGQEWMHYWQEFSFNLFTGMFHAFLIKKDQITGICFSQECFIQAWLTEQEWMHCWLKFLFH